MWRNSELTACVGVGFHWFQRAPVSNARFYRNTIQHIVEQDHLSEPPACLSTFPVSYQLVFFLPMLPCTKVSAMSTLCYTKQASCLTFRKPSKKKLRSQTQMQLGLLISCSQRKASRLTGRSATGGIAKKKDQKKTCFLNTGSLWDGKQTSLSDVQGGHSSNLKLVFFFH